MAQRTDIHPDQLIVDAADHEGVTSILKSLTVWPAVPASADEESSFELDLVLVKNLVLGHYIAGARDRYEKEIAARETAGREFTDLDVLLLDVRTRFKEAHGCFPIVGKNRESIIGYPQHKGVVPPTPIPGPVAIGTGEQGRGVQVGVVDTPFARHDLLPGVTFDEPFGGFTSPAEPATTWAGHGTFVAGLILQSAPRAGIFVRAGLSANEGESTLWTAARMIARFASDSPQILNLSLGCKTDDNDQPLLIERALFKLGADTLVVAAAGNHGQLESGQRIWPAAARTVVAVGALPGSFSDGEVATFSVKEPWVDCLAPGIEVASTYLDGPVNVPAPLVGGEHVNPPIRVEFDGYARWSGTSFSAATVSGLIAARMTTAGVDARTALEQLLDDPGSPVRRADFPEV